MTHAVSLAIALSCTLCSCFSCAPSRASARTPARTVITPVKRVVITPVKHVGVRDAPGVDTFVIGDLWLVSQGGSKTRISRTGLAYGAKVSPNGKEIGWIEGQIMDYPDQEQPMIPNVGYPQIPTLFPAALVFRRHWSSGRAGKCAVLCRRSYMIYRGGLPEMGGRSL